MFSESKTEGDVAGRLTLARLSAWLSGRLTAWQPPTDVVLIGTALLVGIGTGVGAVLFRYLIQGVGWIGYQWVPEVTSGWGKLYVVLVPAIGGLIVGPLLERQRGTGVPR